MEFWKYSGAGNDFILFDGSVRERFPPELLKRLCDRRNGIGADGVLFVSKLGGDLDFAMNYLNADGGEVEMCGNGARACVHWFATTHKKTSVSFETSTKNIYRGNLLASERAEVTMNECFDENIIDVSDFFSVKASCYMNTGVPHAVFILKDDQSLDAQMWMDNAPRVRNDERFERGCNVNFAKVLPDGRISLRTYERGVEGETLACGTGAMAVARFLNKELNQDQFTILVGGGVLKARVEKENWWLEGPIVQVFKGKIGDEFFCQ